MPYVDIILRIGTSTLPWHLHNFESGAILLNVYLTQQITLVCAFGRFPSYINYDKAFNNTSECISSIT